MHATIETPQLILRPHRVDDFEQYAALLGESEPLVPYALPAFNREDAWARMLRFVGHWSHFGYGLFLAHDRATHVIVAEVGVAIFKRAVDSRCEGVPEAGWRVARRMRRRGIAVEAMQAVLSWFDREIAEPRTFCMIHPDNAASLRVASRLGYRELSRGEFRGGPVISLERRPQ